MPVRSLSASNSKNAIPLSALRRIWSGELFLKWFCNSTAVMSLGKLPTKTINLLPFLPFLPLPPRPLRVFLFFFTGSSPSFPAALLGLFPSGACSFFTSFS
uniref:Putative uncharacterized protein YDL213W-A n=1 Tax=Saccharomyces cerevisiae (strain ATCC 204508 / S288c) TaxID=559292 RepID=YD213_YEAST|nr:RecName: Full=Putative uncharacterized protein YDL213W-A [Saccharomyces cerevisiae S288C]CAA67477.1 unnamed protein product [Saccharomyces cerevisiae]